MVSAHIAHDCFVGNNVILANNVPLGGHAHIDDNAIIGGNSAVQQFTRVGKVSNDRRDVWCCKRYNSIWYSTWK